MFSELYHVIIPHLGQFFAEIVYLATIRFGDFVYMLTSPTVAYVSLTNLFTGSSFNFSFGNLSVIIGDWLNNVSGLSSIDVVANIVSTILSAPIKLVEYFTGQLFSFFSMFLGLSEHPTWVSFLIIAGSSFIPVVAFKAVRKILW